MNQQRDERVERLRRQLNTAARRNREAREHSEAEVARLRRALERVYQAGVGPHVEIARRALSGDADA